MFASSFQTSDVTGSALAAATMGCFAAAAMMTVLGSALAYFQFENAFHFTVFLAFVVGIAGVTSLINGSALTVRETRMAFALLHEEVEEVLKERR